MYYYKFNLREYVNETNYLFKYYETKIKENKLGLIELLDSLGIARSTYRKAKILEQKAGIIIIEKLHKHFNTILVSNEDIIYCEHILSKIFTKIYFRILNDIEELNNELKRLISLDNYLKPIFVLFKMFIEITNIKKGYHELKKDLSNDFVYVKKYYDFFSSELKAIFILIDIFLTEEDIDTSNHFNIINNNDFIHGSYYFYIAVKSLIIKDYRNAVMHFKEGIEIYFKENNFNRIILAVNNLCICYNCLEMYLTSYKELKKYIVLVYYNNPDIFKLFKIQYYQTLFILNLEIELIEFYNMVEEKNINDYFYLSLWYYKNNNIDEFQKVAIKITDSNSFQYTIINFLNNHLNNKVSIPKELYIGYNDVLSRILKSI